MLELVAHEAGGGLPSTGSGAAKAKGKSERASEETEGAKGAQDDRTTATGATTYPRDAEGWIAPAGGHAEYPWAKERTGHDDNPAWGQGETKSTTHPPPSLQHLAQASG